MSTSSVPPNKSSNYSSEQPRGNKPRPYTAPADSKGKTSLNHEGVAKKRQGRDLSFYVDYILSNTPNAGHDNPSDAGKLAEETEVSVRHLLRRLSEVLEQRSGQFAQTFQPLLPDADQKLKVETRGGQQHLDVSILLKRPIYPNMFEVRTGHLHGLPPGCALYRIRKCQSSEEDLVMRRMWKSCLDKAGFVSPLKIYPWLAKALLDAVVYLRERETEWKHLDFRLQATFPVIRMELTLNKNMTFTSPQPSNPDNSRGRMSSAQNGSVRDRDLDSVDLPSPNSPWEGVTLGTPWDNHSDLDISRVQSASSTRLSNSRGTSARSREIPQDPAGSSILGTSRKSVFSALSTHPSTAWEYLEDDEDKDITIMTESPSKVIHLNLIPVIEGFGWPKAIRIPQLLPNQRPWSMLAKQWANDLRERVRDGESFWELSAFDPVDILEPGRQDYIPYWKIDFSGTHGYLLSRMSEMPFSGTLDGLFDLVEMVTSDKGKVWVYLGSEAKDSIRSAAIKGNLHRNRTLGDWFLLILNATIRAIEGRLSGRRWQADRNIAQEEEGEGRGLLEALHQVGRVSREDPRRLIEMITHNDPTVEDALDLSAKPPDVKVRRSSTPIVMRRSSAVPVEEPIVKPKPAKPPRMLYRLFRKDF